MDKLLKYCGYIPGVIFSLFFVLITIIGGFNYLKQIPMILYIHLICLWIAPFFISNKNHRLVGYIAVIVSFVCYIYQGFMDPIHFLFYVGISIVLIIYFIGYDYILRRSK